MDSIVVGTWTGTGATKPADPAERYLIRIKPVFGEGVVTEDSESYLFLTYDSGIRVRVVSGGYTLTSDDNETFEWGTQTALLMRATGVAGLDTEIVLQLVQLPTAAVRWRAAAVVMTGSHAKTRPVWWMNAQDVPALEPGHAGVLFFGHPGSQFGYTDAVMTQVVDLADGQHHIDAVTWGSNAGGMAVAGGPWFVTMVETYIEQGVVGPPIVERPPPTDADSFWADRACCQCADVFVINNDKLAEDWDVASSEEFLLGDTLLLNWTDPDGTRWSMTDIDGWWTLPEPDLPDLPRAGYLDGSFPVDGRYNARVFTVSGVFLPGPGVSVAVPRQRMLRALDAVRGGALFVAKEPVWTKQSWVYLEGQPKITTQSVSQLTLFEFSLKAIDPVKYHAGTEGLSKTTIFNASVKYLGRSYSIATGGELDLPTKVSYTWDSDPVVNAPAAGRASSSGARFDQPLQTLCVSGTATGGGAVDLADLKIGDGVEVQGKTSGAGFFGIIVADPLNHGSWMQLEVEADPDASTAAKPTNSEVVSTAFIRRGDSYTEEAVKRGMRFRYPEGSEVPTEIWHSPNPYRRYEEHVKSGKGLIINAGTTKVFPRFYIYGYCVNPIITNQTTGQQMRFTGTISEVDMLVVDCHWRAIVLRPAEPNQSLNPISDVQGQSARHMLDFTSQWIGLIPGENLITVDASSWSETAKVVVVHRSGWLG